MKANNTFLKMTLTGKKIKMMLAALLATAAMAGGCDSEDEKTYDLTVGWNINGFEICSSNLPETQFAQSEVVFTTVQVNVYEDETKAQSVQAPISVPCAQFATQITRLPRGKYYVTLDAYADYDGDVIPFFQGEKEVSIPKDGDSITIPLVAGTGEILVYWQFSGGKTCGVDMAGEVTDVAIFVNGQQTKTTCGSGQVLLPDIAMGTSYTVSAQALDASGNVLYTAQYLPSVSATEFTVLPGERYSVPLVFQ